MPRKRTIPSSASCSTALPEPNAHIWICSIRSRQGKAPTSTATDPAPAFRAFYPTLRTPEKQADSYLCADLLSTEKHVSALYNTCVFEFTQNDLRKVLNRIPTDEQYHGEQLWKYMSVNSMYS